ncbi:uncharacterized protein [Rutidosis leptorrhynchoides]|uniref:uncharacterized protein n=1 Tax=Rutidosis leptorrhynchoides TaxID=125765 RepID=UPI003A9A2AFB
MSSEMEPVPLTTHKRDPAWKHCEMFKSEDRVLLKCLYCLKIFKGGGIHRIKGHLACQKGNAATCLKVPADVRLEMQRSLHNSSGSSGKKRKKEVMPEESEKGNPISSENYSFDANLYDVNTSLHLVGNPLTPESHSTLALVGDQGGDRRKRGKGKGANASDILVIGQAERKVNEHLHMTIGRFLYDIGAPLDAVNSVYFQQMVEAIVSAGSGALLPSHHDLRNTTLKNSIEEAKDNIHKIMGTWSKTGCSVLLDQWTMEMGRTLLSVLVYCPEGTVFLKSVDDASTVISNSEALYELLRQVVEEVGEANVLQVITYGDEQFMTAGRRLADSFPSLYWSPCAAHSVDMMLDDFAKIEWINAVIEQAKSITRYVYNNAVVLNMLRRFNFGNDIIEPGLTRVASSFSTLKRMINLKHNLQSMVTSQEWVDCPYSKQIGGLEMLDIVSNQSFWSSCDLIVRLTNPLLSVSRIVRSMKRPSIGYVYASMYKAKEVIKKELVKREDYMPYWNLIDRWWEQQWQNPIHAAGFYLNPKFFYSIERDMPSEIVSGMYDCIERLVPDTNVQDKIIKEISSYKSAAGDFGRKMAIRAKDTLLPAEWWSTYGGSCPNLARLAIRILSQTCCSTVYRQNQIPLGQIHTTSNCLERQRIKDIVFVQNNLRLRQWMDKNREENSVDLLSYDCISLVEDWVICKEDNENSDWTTLEPPPHVNPTPLGPPNDEFEEDLDSVFDDAEIFNRAKDENVC